MVGLFSKTPDYFRLISINLVVWVMGFVGQLWKGSLVSLSREVVELFTFDDYWIILGIFYLCAENIMVLLVGFNSS